MKRSNRHDIEALIEGVLDGDWRATARAISIVEDGRPGRMEILGGLYSAGRGSYVCGITGPSGAGKSTLVDIALIDRIQPVAEEPEHPIPSPSPSPHPVTEEIGPPPDLEPGKRASVFTTERATERFPQLR